MILLIQFSYSEKPIDLSDLAFEDTIQSKLMYGLFFFSSFISVGTSFGRVLKWGKTPVIKKFASIKFIKIILLLLTRFFIYGIILSVAVKSLMFQFVINSVFDKEDRQIKEIIQIYYRGICVKSSNPTLFCANAEILNFDTATLYAPLFMICILYLPSFLCVLILSFRFFGWKKWREQFFENPVLFIFPIWTSFSFYKNLGIHNIMSRFANRSLFIHNKFSNQYLDPMAKKESITSANLFYSLLALSKQPATTRGATMFVKLRN